MVEQSDHHLVDAVMGGDRGAFATLVERYKRLAVAVAAEIVRDRHTAEDVAQEAFVTAYERLRSLRNRDVFGSWLLKITRRGALRSARRQRRLPTYQPVSGDTLDNRNGQNGQLEDRSQELLILLRRLPEHERVVMMLKYFEDHSVLDIAGMIGRPVGSVTKLLTRARRRLETWFKESEQ